MARTTSSRTTAPARDRSARPTARSTPFASAIGNQARLRVLQPQLRIGAVDDPLERQADSVADSVMRMPDTAVLQRKCAACEQDDAALRREASSPASSSQVAPDVVHDVLRSPGSPLDAATAQFMSARMGYDFGAVRVHTDSGADASARAVGANAYTVGDDIVFAAGQHQPATETGRRLIAHELAHVVQQDGGGPAVRRQPAAKSDVAIVLTDDQGDMAAAGAYAQTVIRVNDVDDAVAKLKALGHPVATLFVVSHSSRAGSVRFDGASGITWVKLSDLGAKLKGATTIDKLDFQGCNLGGAPDQLEAARAGAGAQTASGVDCWTFTQTLSPLTLGGTAITNRSQIPPGQQAAFDTALLQNVSTMKADNDKPVQNCIVGLNAGENAGRAVLAKLWQIYEKNKGTMVASWASPEYNHDWQDKSRCTKDLTATTTPCSIVTKTAPPAAPAAPPKAPGTP